MSWSRTIRTSK